MTILNFFNYFCERVITLNVDIITASEVVYFHLIYIVIFLNYYNNFITYCIKVSIVSILTVFLTVTYSYRLVCFFNKNWVSNICKLLVKSSFFQHPILYKYIFPHLLFNWKDTFIKYLSHYCMFGSVSDSPFYLRDGGPIVLITVTVC